MTAYTNPFASHKKLTFVFTRNIVDNLHVLPRAENLSVWLKWLVLPIISILKSMIVWENLSIRICIALGLSKNYRMLEYTTNGVHITERRGYKETSSQSK